MTRLLLLLLLLGNTSFGQLIIRGNTTINTDSFISDSINNSPSTPFNKRIKLPQIDKSTANIDIRLYRLYVLTNTTTLYRLYSIDTIWHAEEYDEYNKPVKIKKHKLIAIHSFDSIFIKLYTDNILTLPNQWDFKSKMRSGKMEVTSEGDTLYHEMRVLDGEAYTTEIKIGNKFRVYTFENPEAYAEFYNNVYELKDYLSIVQIFSKFLQ